MANAFEALDVTNTLASPQACRVGILGDDLESAKLLTNYRWQPRLWLTHAPDWGGR